MDGNSPDAGTIYYNDGSISISGQILSVGAPYNQTYNLRSIVGTSYGKDKSGQALKFLWISLSLFGLLFGCALNSNDNYVIGYTVLAGSAAILWKTLQGYGRPYVELKFGGLNNQMLYMKKMSQAQELAACINMAIQDMHNPPDSGQFVAPSPIFPSPVFTRN